MPKGGSDEYSMSRANSSKYGSQDKVAISKPMYQRPKHERVFCRQCENHPDGFRGEHELRKYRDREHKALVKKWVCIEPTGKGHLVPELPLSRCKACGVQRKKYGTYYQAAAHRRRTHFRTKANRTSMSKREDNRGANWPPMSELKYWMKEVEVPSEYNLTQFQQHGAASTGDTDDYDDMSEQDFNSQMPSLYQTLGPFENTPHDIFGDPTSFHERRSFEAPGMPTNEPFPRFQSQTSMVPTSYNTDGGMDATSDAYVMLVGEYQGRYVDDNMGIVWNE